MRKRKWLAGLLAAAMCSNLIPVGAFATELQNGNVQVSSAEETIYTSTFDSSARSVDFSDHWRFNLGGGDASAQDFNDSAWREVDLPHDYSIEQNYTTSGEAESGYLPGGTGWYRKTFTADPEWRDKVVSIDFGGVYMRATVFLNGTQLGFHPYGYTSFSFVLPGDLLNYDGDNVLAVKVEHQIPSSRWYSGSGIYRSVYLTLTDPVHVARYGTFVTTPNLANSDGSDGTVEVETTVENDSDAAASVTLRQTIYEKGGTAVVASAESLQTVQVEAGGQNKIPMTLQVDSPKLWSTDDPNLYTLVTEVLVDGAVTDSYSTEFGFRWTEFNSTTGFALNGVPMKLKGVSMHHDQGPLGSEAWYRAIERQVEILKKMGVNAIRVTHNPAAAELIQIANEKGMMIVDEAFDGWVKAKNGNSQDYSAWFDETIKAANSIVGGETGMTWAEFDLKAMVYQDRNAPAVIMYSLGNEIFEGTSGTDRKNEYPGIARNLCTWLQEVDPTRPPTIGHNKALNDDTYINQVSAVIQEFGGVIGVNYGAGNNRFQSWKNAGYLAYHAETASAVNSRGVYDRKANNSDGGKGDRLLTSYDKSAVGWGAVASQAWYHVLEEDASMGEFVWTGFDYLGEPTPWNGVSAGAQGSWPSPKSSYFGIVDTAGIPKDTYWFYQSQWNDQVNTLHLLPTWDRDDVVIDSSGKVEVVVYSDAPVIKLYLNGTEVGTATSTVTNTPGGAYTYRSWNSGTGAFQVGSAAHQKLYATFLVEYEEGTLEVKAFQADGTTPITDTDGRSVVKSTSGAAQLEVEADRQVITADGDDLSYLTIRVKDANGNLVNTDDVSITLSIQGEGKIIGVDNGRQTDHTSYQSLTRSAGAGELVAVVQSTQTAGSFTVTATANGLSSGSATVTTQLKEEEVSTGSPDDVMSYTLSRYHYVKLGNTPVLPQTSVVTFRNGDSQEKAILWNRYDPSLIQQTGEFQVEGSIADTDLTVRVTITILDAIAGVLNYSTAVQLGATVNLPNARPAILPDGTILNAEFPVQWDSTHGIGSTEGVYTVNGTSQVFGETFAVTATVRVAEGNTVITTDNVAGAATLSQSVPAGQQSDTLSAIQDGSIDFVAPSSGVNGSAWTNYQWSQEDAANDTAEITFTYATAQYLGRVELYFFTDTYATQLPQSVALQWSPGGDVWYDLSVSETPPVEVGQYANGGSAKAVVYKAVYDLNEPVSAVQLRVQVTNQAGSADNSGNRNYCVGITEAKLLLAKTEFPVSSAADLSAITVNGVAVDATSLAQGEYRTEALRVDTLEVESAHNAAYTILPVHEKVVRILTESEDQSAREVYEILLDTEPTGSDDPTDASRDYPREQTIATAASAHTVEGQAGLPEYVRDGNSTTIWHTAWDENLSTAPERRWIQLELEQTAMIDALRYLPRNNIGNGMVTEYRVEVSLDGASWTTVAEGSWALDTQWKLAVFEQPVQAKYVRLYGVETRGAANDIPNKFMSCAELRVRVAQERMDLSGAQVSLEQERYLYTGQEIQPMPTVTLGETQLRYGVDFLVDYGDNVQPGTAVVSVRGIVQYGGSVEKTFTISAQNMAQSYTPVAVKTYVGQAPTLPDLVTAQVGEGKELQLPVEWAEIDPAQYAQHGVFTVQGVVEEQELKITAEITVISPIGVEATSTAVVVGQVPGLPQEMDVYFSDGTTERHPVVWSMDGVDTSQIGTTSASGIVTVAGETLHTTASIRVEQGTERTDNLAQNQNAAGNELPFAMGSHGPEVNDPASNVIDGSRTPTAGSGKVVWTDWVSGTYHSEPWIGVILGQGDQVQEELVNRISIGFIEEESGSANKVRLPEGYTVQYYVGDLALLEQRNPNRANNAANWALANDENWKNVDVISQEAVPTTSSAVIADLCDVTFQPVRTAAIRVVLQPKANNWVGVDELEIYGMEALEQSSQFTVTSITLGGEELLDQFDGNREYTAAVAPGEELPELAAQASGTNPSITIVPPSEIGVPAYVKVTSEDGSKTETYTIHFIEDAPVPEETVTVTFNSDGGSPVKAATVERGEAVPEPADPTREGYTFQGWYLNGVRYDFTQAVTEDITLVALWQMQTFTVTFRYENGTTDQKIPVNWGQAVAAPETPAKEGYVFVEWRQEGSESAYDFQTPVKENLTLVAHWEKAIVTVIFDPQNGGSGTTEVKVPHGGMVSAEQVPADPTKEGHTFDGWYLGEAPFDLNTPVTTDITLVAHWTPMQYTVSFQTEGGSEVPPVTVAWGEMASQPEKPTKEGYRFLGWYLGEEEYNFEAPVTSDLELVAKWEIQTFTVTFQVDGEAYSTAEVEWNTTVSKPDDPVKEGHLFKGWQLEGVPYDFAVPVTKDLELIAAWAETVTVTFNSDGGSSVEAATVEKGMVVDQPADPTKEGYTFQGWYLNGVPYDFTQAVTEDITLVALWQMQTFTVTFRYENGTTDQKIPVNWGQAVAAPETPAKEGYVFVEWRQEGSESAYDFQTPVKENLTLVAHWEKAIVTVIFDPQNGGSGTTEVKVPHGGMVSAEQVPADPTKEGHTFDGWYLGEAPFDLNTPVTTDITLVAHWTPMQYTVSFQTEGGSEVPPVTVAWGEMASQPEKPTKEGYRFLGWYLGEEEYNFEAPVTSDLELVAKWEIQTFTVTFQVDGEAYSTAEVEWNTTVSKPDDPIKEGHLFKGWQLEGAPYDFAVPVTKDMELIAVWAETVTVTFNSDGGSLVKAATVERGEVVPEPADPTREGYTFQGWYLNGTAYDFAHPVETDLTLVARWSQNGGTGGGTGGIGGGIIGGGGGLPGQLPHVEDTANGDVTLTSGPVTAGGTVQFMPSADEGYEVAHVLVTDSQGKRLPVTQLSNGAYSFLQPEGQANIRVTFRETDPEPLPFQDVAAQSWYEEAVRYAYDNGLMLGTGTETFSPKAPTVRCMVVAILHRLAGEPEPEVSGPRYQDVGASAYYSQAVYWARQHGIVKGYSDEQFGPNDDMTRQQLAAILYRYAQHMGYYTEDKADLSRYEDVDQVSSWGMEAMAWANAEGLILGVSDTSIDPNGRADRAQVAAILMRFCQRYVQMH